MSGGGLACFGRKHPGAQIPAFVVVTATAYSVPSGGSTAKYICLRLDTRPTKEGRRH